MKTSKKARLYMDFLESEGFKPYVDKDGDVIFKSEGRTYFIDVDEDDDEYFRLVFPNFWSIDSHDELAKAFYAANRTTMAIKTAKVYVRGDGKNVVAAIEMFVSGPDGFKDTFSRCMSALRTSVQFFVKTMQEEAN